MYCWNPVFFWRNHWLLYREWMPINKSPRQLANSSSTLVSWRATCWVKLSKFIYCDILDDLVSKGQISPHLYFTWWKDDFFVGWFYTGELMDIQKLTSFLLGCLLINVTLLIFSTIIITCCKTFIYRIHSKLFSIKNETLDILLYAFLGIYKLLIIVFNLVPYIVLVWLECACH